MPKLILEVNNENDIADQRWLVYDLSFSNCLLVFIDSETKETVERFNWSEERGFYR